ncbi:MAG: ankyrin repeat domain-containing protein [Armatimonas sp.]
MSAVLSALYQGDEAGARAAAEAAGNHLTLLEAAALGDDLTIRLMLQARWGGDIEARSDDGFTALQYAAYFGHFDALKTLLEDRANVHAVSENGMKLQALHAACTKENKTEDKACSLAAALIRAGADPNATQEGGFTPLKAAKANGWPKLEKLLLAAGATE